MRRLSIVDVAFFQNHAVWEFPVGTGVNDRMRNVVITGISTRARRLQLTGARGELRLGE